MTTEDIIEYLYRIMHMVVWVHTPGDQRWILPIFVSVLVIAPIWLAWQIIQNTISYISKWRRSRRIKNNVVCSRETKEKQLPLLEKFIINTTFSLQIRVIILSM